MWMSTTHAYTCSSLCFTEIFDELISRIFGGINDEALHTCAAWPEWRARMAVRIAPKATHGTSASSTSSRTTYALKLSLTRAPAAIIGDAHILIAK